MISFKVEMRQNAARNERHVKPSAELWHASDASNSGSASSPSARFFLVLSTSVHDLAGAAEARLDCAISYMFTLLASFWAYFPPFNISPDIILHFLKSDTPCFISPLWRRNLAMLSGPRCPCFKACHRVQFGNWSELEEKESSPPRKHLDNCLLQHEKQLEVSGSWEQRGWGRGRPRGRRVSSLQRVWEGTERERGEVGNSAGVRRKDPFISRGS